MAYYSVENVGNYDWIDLVSIKSLRGIQGLNKALSVSGWVNLACVVIIIILLQKLRRHTTLSIKEIDRAVTSPSKIK